LHILCPATAGITGLPNLTSLQLRIASTSTLQQLPSSLQRLHVYLEHDQPPHFHDISEAMKAPLLQLGQLTALTELRFLEELVRLPEPGDYYTVGLALTASPAQVNGCWGRLASSSWWC
jgi:hypothetical protein